MQSLLSLIGQLKSRGSILALGASLAACSGDIVSQDGSGGAGDPTVPGLSRGDLVTPTGECGAELGPMYLRRLTNQEYENTVRDLLGTEPSIEQLPADLVLHGFDNNAESIAISPAHLEAYRSVAEDVAAELVQAPTRQTTVGCDPASGAACIESFIRQFGERAFRRPLVQEEVTDLLMLAGTATADEGAWGSVGRVVEALLQSPSFLFRVEVGTPEPARTGVVRLTGYVVATRLSYLLWGTMPDASLMQAAAGGALDTPEGVQAQALSMLAAEQTKDSVWSFARQWLRVNNLAHLDRPTEEFPDWSEELRDSMTEETRRVVEDTTSRPGVPVLDLFSTPTTFVDSSLASFYGVSAPANGEWGSVTLPAERRGILTNASILTLTANTVGTTPILRGKYIRQAVLCDELPPPPPEVPMLPDAQPGLSERDRLALHRTDPACEGCHSLLEPLGFGLSNFDPIGAYRETDDSGTPIDAQGVIEGYPDATFNGASELVERLRNEPKVGECLSTHLVRYALGRKETSADTCTIGQLGEVLSQGGDFASLVSALVTSEPFRYRLAADQNQGASP